MNSVKVVGLGAVCANGLSKEQIFASVAKPASAIDSLGFASLTGSQWSCLTEKVPEDFRDSKCTQLGYESLQQALQETGWSSADLAEAGFIFASTTAQIDQWEHRLPTYKNQNPDADVIRHGVANQSLGTPLLRLARHFGVRGPHNLISSSCSASLQAIAMATLWIKSGCVRRCIVGATEIQSDLTRVGFGSLRLLAKDTGRPFDKNRLGINLGEAGAFLCLEESSLRTDSAWGFVRGEGFSTDAFHATSPHPEGRGSQIAMTMALQKAGLSASDIDWIYTHGTGSPANDLAEANAITQVFTHNPFVTSTKASHGHTLGASGALESVLGLMALKENKILPTFSFQEPDPKIPLKIQRQTTAQPFQHFLKNSLGFGGINASVIFSKQRGSR